MSILTGADVTDTIAARPVQGLVVEVRGDDGNVVSGAAVRFETSSEGRMSVSTVAAQDWEWTNVAGAVTDARGRAVIRVRMSENVGTGSIVISVPAYALVDTARYTVLPGKPVRVSLVPRDTVIALGMSFTYRGTLIDRMGNPRLDPATFELVGDAITLSAAGVVNTRAYGTARVRVRASASELLNVVDSGTVMVVPTATIVWGGYDRMRITDLLGRELKTINASGEMPSWEPGGERFVAANSGLILVGADNTVTSLPTPGFQYPFWPEWATDGYIYFAGNTGNGSRLGRVRPDGTGLETLMPDEPANMPSVSPDGRHLVYVGREPHRYLRVLDLQTRTTSLLLSMTADAPRWSPDGNWIASTGPRGELWLVRPDGTDAHRVGHHGLWPGITWSPDSRWILGYESMSTLVDLTTGTMSYLQHRRFNPAWKR